MKSSLKKDIKYILKMKKIFYKYSENVQEKLKNKKISNKRNILRFIDKNKIQFSKNKDIIKLSSKVKKAIKEKFDKSFFRSLNIDHTLLKKDLTIYRYAGINLVIAQNLIRIQKEKYGVVFCIYLEMVKLILEQRY